MTHLNKFIVKDCLGTKIGTFTIAQSKVEDFVNEADIPTSYRQSVQLTQRYFWHLMMQYKTEKQWRAMMARYDANGHGGDAFYYVQYA